MAFEIAYGHILFLHSLPILEFLLEQSFLSQSREAARGTREKLPYSLDLEKREEETIKWRVSVITRSRPSWKSQDT